MLNITFYKGCIVNNTYAEVFDLFNNDENGATAFSRYLASLESYSIQLADVYLTDSGKLDIDLAIYDESVIHRFEQFNYMRLSDDAGSIPRYCFIDEFRIINGMAVFSYSADVWHTYAALMRLRSSVLTHSLALKYNSFKIRDYRRPRALETSQVYKPFTGAYLPTESSPAIPSDLLDKVNLLVEFSAYQSTTPDTAEFRDTFFAIVTPITATTLCPSYTLLEIEDVVQQLISGIPLNKLGANFTTSLVYEFNFDIKNIYLIPETLGLYSYGWTQPTQSSYFSQTNYIYAEYQPPNSNKQTLTRQGFRFWNFSATYMRTLLNKNQPIATLVHSQIYGVNNLNNFLFGNLSHQVSLGGRSLTPYFDIVAAVGLNSFNLKMRVKGQFIDITEDYHYIPTLTTMSREAFESQRIAYEVSKLNNTIQIASQVLGIVGDVQQAGQKAAEKDYSAAGRLPLTLTQRGLNITGTVAQRLALEAPTNVITAAQSSNSTTLDNVRAGLLAFIPDLSEDVTTEKGNTDNLTLLYNADQLVGYACEVVVDNAVFYPADLSTSPKFNVIQFNAVNITGVFSQSIAQVLTKILMNGTRIWYSEDVRENIAYDV